MENSNISQVMVWASSAVEIEQGFLSAVVESFTQFKHGNRTDLSILLTVTHGIKTDLVNVIEGERMAYATPLKNIMAIVMPSISFKRDKAKKSGVSYSQNIDKEVDTDLDKVLAELTAMAQDGMTIRNAVFKEWLKSYAKPVEVTDKGAAASAEKAEKDAVRFAKAAVDAGHDKLAYLLALQDELTKEISHLQSAAALKIALAA